MMKMYKIDYLMILNYSNLKQNDFVETKDISRYWLFHGFAHYLLFH